MVLYVIDEVRVDGGKESLCVCVCLCVRPFRVLMGQFLIVSFKF